MTYRIETLNLLILITLLTAEIILLLHFCEVVQCKHAKRYYYIHT